MTIVTKPISENKVDKPVEKPLVVSVNEGAGVECVEAGLGHFDVDGNPKADPEGDESCKKKPRAAGRLCRMVVAPTKIFVFVGALCLLTCAIIYGIYVYRRYTHNQMSRLRVWCGVPLPLDYMPPRAADQFRLKTHKKPSHWPSHFSRNVFNEQFDLDLDTNTFEEIFVPDFGNRREGRFIHDLKLNLTGIVDVSGKRCFVLPLNYSQVATPRNLFKALRKFGRGGFYEGNMIVIRETKRVIRPPVSDVSEFGPYIAQSCRDYQTYRLIKVTRLHRLRTKRSSETDSEEEIDDVAPYKQTDDHFSVMEFAGKNIIEYTIIDE